MIVPPCVLVYVPNGRMIPASLRSILALDTRGFEASLWFDREYNNPESQNHADAETSPRFQDWYARHAFKLERARQWALDLDMDALLTVEDDIIVPPLALRHLWSVEADVVYGLAVCRPSPHKWSAALEMHWAKEFRTLEDDPARVSAIWGRPVETLGCGFFCTLIRRAALERLTFRQLPDIPAAADWALAFDARDAGLRQMTHTGVVCGHLNGHGEALYPCKEPPFWRSEALSA